MVSLQMRLIATFLRLTAKPKMSTAELARRRMTEQKGRSAPPPRLQKRHDVSRRVVDGFETWTVAPCGGSDRAVLYLHGGAFIAAISPQHWDLVARLADAGVRVEVPMYGLAPQFTYRDAYPLLHTAYEQLLKEHDPHRIGLAGDSAGAGLALGFAQDLLATATAPPARLVLIAPWLDLTLSGDGIEHAAARDPWLTPAGLREAGKVWAGGDDPRQPQLSPVCGPLAGLPPTDIYIGDRDLFLPDVHRIHRLAADAGWPLTVIECAGGVHVYPLVPAPEGRRARERIVTTLST